MSMQPRLVPISEVLRAFLRQHETKLRNMAEAESECGKFTVGLSRCLDILDVERDRRRGEDCNIGKSFTDETDWRRS